MTNPEIPSVEAREWMYAHADDREMSAGVSAMQGDHEMAKLHRDCAWAYRFVAEVAKVSEAASAPNKGTI